MKVKELIEELKQYNQDAELTVGDNFYNGISITYGGGGDGETKESCKFVCFDKVSSNNESEYSEVTKNFNYNVWE